MKGQIVTRTTEDVKRLKPSDMVDRKFSSIKCRVAM